MDGRSTASCRECISKMVCHCLQVRETSVVEAVKRLALTTLQEVRDYTSAGNGCNCCHGRIRQILSDHGFAAEAEAIPVYASSSSSEPICSVR